MNLYQKLIEIRKLVKCLQKDTVGKVGFKDYPYISTDLILDKIMDKMNELEVLLEPNVITGVERESHYQNSKGDSKIDFVVNGRMNFVWINAENPEEREVIEWFYYGQQDEVSKAYGSGLTYSNRYFLKMHFQIATSEDDPDQRDTTGKQPYQKTQFTPNVPKAEVKHDGNISEAQLKRLYAIANKKGYKSDSVVNAIAKKLNCEPKDMTREQYDTVVKGYEELNDKAV